MFSGLNWYTSVASPRIRLQRLQMWLSELNLPISISFTEIASLCARRKLSNSSLFPYWIPMSNALLDGARVTPCDSSHFESGLLVGNFNGDQLFPSVAKIPVLRVGAGRGTRLLPSVVELLNACGAMNVEGWSARSTAVDSQPCTGLCSRSDQQSFLRSDSKCAQWCWYEGS